MMKKVKQFAKPEGRMGKLATYLMNLGNQALYHSVYDATPKSNDIAILDIGYGNGYLLHKYLQNSYTNVSGLEISKTMEVLVSHKLANAISKKYCNLKQGGVEDMPFQDNTFDYTYSINTLYFWNSLETGLQEIIRVGKHKSLCALAFYDRRALQLLPYTKTGFHLYDTKEIEKALSACNLKIKAIRKKKFDIAICYVVEINKE